VLFRRWRRRPLYELQQCALSALAAAALVRAAAAVACALSALALAAAAARSSLSRAKMRVLSLDTRSWSSIIVWRGSVLLVGACVAAV
jgi:hypothetical protein